MTNMDKLYEAVAARGPVCVGLDTDFSYLPADFVDTALTKGENIVRFNKKLIDATKAVAGCYKVQIAYYESLGLEGMKAYAETLAAVREAGIPVIADIKRGDIAKTAEMYAMGHFTGDFESDFVTLAPYMGLDSISPYLPYAEKQGKGMFVLCRTSNGGAKDFEYEKLADGRHVVVTRAGIGESIVESLRGRLSADHRQTLGLRDAETHPVETGRHHVLGDQRLPDGVGQHGRLLLVVLLHVVLLLDLLVLVVVFRIVDLLAVDHADTGIVARKAHFGLQREDECQEGQCDNDRKHDAELGS